MFPNDRAGAFRHYAIAPESARPLQHFQQRATCSTDQLPPRAAVMPRDLVRLKLRHGRHLPQQEFPSSALDRGQIGNPNTKSA
jgi:hypothetical protein